MSTTKQMKIEAAELLVANGWYRPALTDMQIYWPPHGGAPQVWVFDMSYPDEDGRLSVYPFIAGGEYQEAIASHCPWEADWEADLGSDEAIHIAVDSPEYAELESQRAGTIGFSDSQLAELAANPLVDRWLSRSERFVLLPSPYEGRVEYVCYREHLVISLDGGPVAALIYDEPYPPFCSGLLTEQAMTYNDLVSLLKESAQ